MRACPVMYSSPSRGTTARAGGASARRASAAATRVTELRTDRVRRPGRCLGIGTLPDPGSSPTLLAEQTASRHMTSVPRAEPRRPRLPRLTDRGHRPLRPRHATPMLARVFQRTRTAKQLLAQYGDRLICVRYRYDAQRKKRLKTVELVVAERDWEPPQPRFAQDQIVGLRVVFADMAVRDRVKQAGGTWNPERRVWQLRYDRVVALGLKSRIVDEPASNSGCPGASAQNLHADARVPSR